LIWLCTTILHNFIKCHQHFNDYFDDIPINDDIVIAPENNEENLDDNITVTQWRDSIAEEMWQQYNNR
jgi:hypothetical protein